MDTEQSSNHDNMLFEMLRECKTLPVFLDHIFGFLSRRTDFYYIATDENPSVGLPEGLAEKIVKHTFYKWKNIEKCIDESKKEAASSLKSSSIEKPLEDNKINSKNECEDELRFTSSDSYNGAIYENYSWSQSIKDVDIIVKIPPNVTSKDLQVEILSNRLKVKVKREEKSLLEGDLCQKCKANDAIWSLDKRKLEIHLDKCTDMWWDCLVQSEPKLDISKIDCSRPFEELSEEAQAKIEELQWNQERKRLGLPTSDELQMQEKLKKAWNAEGSPFSGPFDPSLVQFN